MTINNNFIKPLIVLILSSISLLSSSQNKAAEHSISGTIQFDSIWSPKIYLSLIPSFNKMFTMSNTMIISVADIDSTGNFRIDTSFLPDTEHFYRIHVSKKDAPAASLIIGGKDENHIFIIASKNSVITLNKDDKNLAFNETEVTSNTQNEAIKIINETAGLIDNVKIEETFLKREFITKGINEKLRFIADTSSNALVSLYAIYKSKFESNFEINKQYYKDYVQKWSSNNSTYFKEFRNSLPLKNEKKSINDLFFYIVSFILGLFVSYYFFRFNKTNKLKSLSIQERKIFKLLQEGKSNKEISDELNIGLSTVKSHVSSVYNKLKIKSRKETLNL